MSVLCSLWDILSGLSVMTWLVVILVLLVSYNYVIKEPWKNLPPGPPALPIVGSLPFLGTDLVNATIALSKKHGQLVTIYLGSRRAVVLHGYDVIKDAFVKNGNIFSGRPSTLFFIKDFLDNTGIAAGQGKKWMELRSSSSRILKEHGVGQTKFEDRIIEEVHFFLEALRSEGQVPLYPFPLLQKSIANVISSVAFGKRFDYQDPVFKRYIENVNETGKKIGSSGILGIFPLLKHLPGDLFSYKRLLNIKEYSRGEYRRYVKEHKAKLTDDTEPADFIDSFLQAMNKQQSSGSALTEEALVRVLDDMFNAGTETTANTLSWAILHLVRNPDIQEQIYKEIEDVVGCDATPRMHHRRSLPRTESFICEVQRFSDVIPLSLPHAPTEDVYFRGYFIPKDTMIIPNMSSVHMDPDVWTNPKVFDPARFLDPDGKVTKKEQFIPFSIGKRTCIGESLARMELFLYFASMVQHFRFRCAPGHPVPSTKGILGITYNPKLFHVIAEKRK